MKKLLALVLALMMTVCIFAACGEKEEASVDGTAEVEALAEDALELLVARDQDGLLALAADPDPAASANAALVGKFTAYDALVTNFEAQVDSWGLSEELAAEVKEYGKTKADAVLASFTAGEITDAVQLGEIITVNAKATLLDVTVNEYEYGYAELYTAPGNYAEFVGVECGDRPVKKLAAPTEEETAANTALADACKAADEEAKAQLATMTIDELKAVTDAIFAKAQTYVVDTDVAFQYKNIDNAWKINNVGISAVEE